MLVKWRESLVLGIDKVDEQHREIFNKTNELVEMRKNRADRKEQFKATGKILDFLLDYVKTHFKSEERLQKDCNYPGYKEHKRVHDEFIKEVDKLKAEYDENNQSMSTLINLTDTLLNWLVKHIDKEDRKIANHVEKSR